MNKALAPVASLLFSVSILLTGQGLQGILLPVRASLEDFSTVAIGAMGAAYFLGFTLGCLRGGELVRRVGYVRVFLAMSATASALPLIHSLVLNPVVWGFLRLATGFCFATLYIVIESWLNARANNENRGLIFSTYSMITLSVLAAGQMMLLMYDPAGMELFVIASVLVSIGAVPVALSRSPSPEKPARIHVDIPRLYKVSPSGTIGSLATGLANGAFWALAPVFASSEGGVELAAWFMTAAVIGGAVSQWPLGILSDRIGRRKVLVAVSLCGAIAGVLLALPATILPPWSTNYLGALWGALAFPLYTLAVAYANDYAEPDEYVMISGGLLLMYGGGAVIGPFIASALMTAFGAGGLFAYAAVIHAALVAFVAVRFVRRRTAARKPIAFSEALAVTQTASQVYEEEHVLEEASRPPGDARGSA